MEGDVRASTSVKSAVNSKWKPTAPTRLASATTFGAVELSRRLRLRRWRYPQSFFTPKPLNLLVVHSPALQHGHNARWAGIPAG